MASRARGLAARLREEEGFTLMELLVTIVLVAVGMIAMISAFDSSRALTSTSEETETATHQAQREMERILSLPYDSIALTSVPTTSTDPNNPSYYVTQGTPATYRWDQGSTGPQSAELVVDATNGTLNPSAISWSDTQSRQEGYLHRFVTWTGDLCAACAGTQRAKRITVAATVTGGKLKKPLLISSIKVDPESANTN